MQNNKLELYYKIYCKYCKQLNVVPVQKQQFHIDLYYVLKMLAHSYYGHYK